MGSPSIYVFDCSNAGCIVDYIRKNVPSLRDQQDMVNIQLSVLLMLKYYWQNVVLYNEIFECENGGVLLRIQYSKS